MSEQLNVAAGGGPINAPRFQANSFHVMSTPTEISILGLSQVIGQSAAGDMELGHMPVFMLNVSPAVAKELATVIGELIATHEKDFGQIDTPFLRERRGQ